MLQWRLKIIHIGYEDKIIGGVDFLAVHERAFYGPLWTKLLGKGLFHGVHQHLYGIVAEQAFIPRCWMHPNSLADYLPHLYETGKLSLSFCDRIIQHPNQRWLFVDILQSPI